MTKQKKLSLKQKRFAQEYIKTGGNGTAAVMNSYNVKRSSTAAAVAYENLRKPHVREAIEQALQASGLTLESVLTTVKNNMIAGEGVKATADSSLRASDMLLRVYGAYPDKRSAHARFEYKIRKDLSKMSVQELERKLEKLHAKTKRLLEDIR